MIKIIIIYKSTNTLDKNKKLVVKVHNSPLTALELNSKGNKFAVMCEKVRELFH